jgi:hypothetical protein
LSVADSQEWPHSWLVNGDSDAHHGRPSQRNSD